MRFPAAVAGAEVGGRSIVLAFATTMALSALLLFSVQPMVAKMLLPVLGGAPATWAVSLCFFQGLLLLGYAYAHLLGNWLRTPWGLLSHACLFAAAVAVLPIGLPSGLTPPAGDPYLWLLAMLAAVSGLPFFSLSANAPLLQLWFGRLGHRQSADPYFLYAASNVGSLAGLLAYPTLIEPLLALPLQGRVWGSAFLLLALAVAGCGLIAIARERAAVALPAAASCGPQARLTWVVRRSWICLAFVPSGLLVAYTTYLTTDLASAPLLWVLPLALYLATFIITFRKRPLIRLGVVLALQPLLVAGALAAWEWKGDYSWAASALLGLLAFLVTSLLCHAQLYQRRPEAAQLTDYYLSISLGGVLGGIFAALLAPLLFTGTLEFPLLLGMGMLARPRLWHTLDTARGRVRLAVLLTAAVASIVLFNLLLANEILLKAHGELRLEIVCGLGLAVVALSRWPQAATAALAAMIAAAVALPSASAPVYATRSFFGTHRVVDSPGGGYRLLMHGTTVHGIEQNRSGVAVLSRPTPLAYYHPSGPLAQGLQLARTIARTAEAPLRIGIVGLGTGAMACYAAPGDRWRFFEIDPAVVHIATTPSLFRYLARCLPAAEIVLGDARLTLAREDDAAFDYLLVDAFSSDAIPVHLLTVEALRLYLGKLSERGILALHISNQNLDLAPVLEANLSALAAVTGIYVEGQRGAGALASQVVLIARDAELLAPALRWHQARRLDQPSVRPWTDDHSDILSAVWRRYKTKLEAVFRQH
jgi:hypothetical protein